MSDHWVSGRRTWTLRAKGEVAPSRGTAPKRVQWTQSTSGWAPTAWRRTS